MSQRRHIPGRCYASAAVCQAKKPPFFFKGGVGSGDSVARLRNSYWVASECLWDYGKPIVLVHRQPDKWQVDGCPWILGKGIK